MKNRKTGYFLIAALFTVAMVLFSSCTVDITIQLNKAGGADIKFFGGAGDGFSQMITSASGVSSDEFIDTQAIEYELKKAGFSKVDIKNATAQNITINFSDAAKNSYLFKTGLLTEKNGVLKCLLNASKLTSFYNLSDEQTQMVLDMLLAPVFNDEEMTQSEYLEMLGTVYGKSVEKEVSSSFVNLTLINLDGTSVNKKIPLAELMTLTGAIKF